jgi:pilus assembly protein CpaF
MEIGVEGTMGALSRVVDWVLVDPGSLDPDDVSNAIDRATATQAPMRASQVHQQASDSLTGMGPLDVLLEDSTVSDILVNAHDEIWIERDGHLERSEIEFPTAEAVIAAVERALLPLGLRLDRASPSVDARLPDGSRLHAMVPPAAVDGPVVAIRRFTAAVLEIEDLVAVGAVDRDGGRIIQKLVADRTNLIVSGATGSGKTTLLNLLSRSIPAGDRIVTVEEAAELRLEGHVVRLESRPPNAEGAGEITVRNLVRQALRMRPDRIIVGEVRGPEALDLIQAMSTGHAGSMGTVHASDAEGAMWRLETLAATAGEVPHDALRQMLWSAIEAIIHVERSGTSRRVRTVSRVVENQVRPVWEC